MENGHQASAQGRGMAFRKQIDVKESLKSYDFDGGNMHDNIHKSYSKTHQTKIYPQ